MQLPIQHRLIPIRSFDKALEWIGMRWFDASCRLGAKTLTRPSRKYGGEAKNVGMGENSRKENFDARIFSCGTFYLIHRWVVVESFGGKILRTSKMLACNAEKC